MYETDVFICGGGPAGLAAALSARQQGLAVLVADCFRPPIDKACGEGMMPDSLTALAKLGISLEGIETGVFRGIRFVEKDKSAEALFPQGVGHGIRRILLHERLHQRAAELGVKFRWETQVMGVLTGVDNDIVQTGSEQIRSRWIIGADGLNSRIRKWTGLEAGKRLSRRIGLRQHYKISPWGDFMEVHWSSAGQAYVTPVSKGEICVVVVARNRFASVDAALPLFPELAARLSRAEHGSSERGALTTGHTYDRVASGRTALIGDASGSVDAVVGDGLALSFLQAEALGHALKQGNLSLYEDAHRRIRQVPTFMSKTLLMMDRFEPIRRKSLSTFHRNPWLFERMLSVHVGATPLTVWGRSGLLNLGLQLLTH
jgi:menaquinone-9 beta-reductase